MVELVDTRALGARALGREGSSPFSRTKQRLDLLVDFLFGFCDQRLGSSREIYFSKFQREGSRSAAQKKELAHFSSKRRSEALAER